MPEPFEPFEIWMRAAREALRHEMSGVGKYSANYSWGQIVVETRDPLTLYVARVEIVAEDAPEASDPEYVADRAQECAARLGAKVMAGDYVSRRAG